MAADGMPRLFSLAFAPVHHLPPSGRSLVRHWINLAALRRDLDVRPAGYLGGGKPAAFGPEWTILPCRDLLGPLAYRTGRGWRGAGVDLRVHISSLRCGAVTLRLLRPGCCRTFLTNAFPLCRAVQGGVGRTPCR